MKDSIEKDLKQWKDQYDHLDIDHAEVDYYIEQGINKAKGKNYKLKPLLMTALSAAAILLFGFIALVNFSTGFQQQVSKVPGLNEFADLFTQDKGLQSAYENNYYEPVDVSQKQGDYELTIDGVIRDQYGLIIYYTLKSDEPKENLSLDNIDLRASSESKLPPGSTSYATPGEDKNNEFSGTFKFFSSEPINVNEFVFSADLSLVSDIHFSIPFKASNSPKPVIYDINKSVTIENQSILVKSVTINPTRTAVKIQHNPDNDMKIFSIDDMRIVDGNGEEWNGIHSGTTRSGPDNEGNVTYYLQSNFFEVPEELYLKFSKAQALPKSQTYLKFDLDKEIILFDPYNIFYNFKYRDDGYISFSMKKLDGFHHGVIQKVIDENGKVIDSHSSFSRNTIESGEEVLIYGYDVKHAEGIIKAELSAYPHWIKEEVRIRIK